MSTSPSPHAACAAEISSAVICTSTFSSAAAAAGSVLAAESEHAVSTKAKDTAPINEPSFLNFFHKYFSPFSNFFFFTLFLLTKIV
ncbi:MAG: hypothetical protein LRY71_12875 [Bacillaceae bacterium]|nr:hypothetical protein [Bacillaceae bacterium]